MYQICHDDTITSKECQQSLIFWPQVTTLYEAAEFPSLHSEEAQSAMVKLVEQVGHSAFISEVVTAESSVQETLTGVFKAFLRSMQVEHLSVEDVLTLLGPEDFKPHTWREEHAQEVRFTAALTYYLPHP
jgi:hypothetical protein